jgi:hypothetical protein
MNEEKNMKNVLMNKRHMSSKEFRYHVVAGENMKECQDIEE